MSKFIMKNVPCKLRYYRSPVNIEVGHYPNGRIALQLWEARGYHEPVATATVNLPGDPCEPFEVYVKDYSENEGMTEFLAGAGIVEKLPVAVVNSGFVMISRYKLTKTFTRKLKKHLQEASA